MKKKKRVWNRKEKKCLSNSDFFSVCFNHYKNTRRLTSSISSLNLHALKFLPSPMLSKSSAKSLNSQFLSFTKPNSLSPHHSFIIFFSEQPIPGLGFPRRLPSVVRRHRVSHLLHILLARRNDANIWTRDWLPSCWGCRLSPRSPSFTRVTAVTTSSEYGITSLFVLISILLFFPLC